MMFVQIVCKRCEKPFHAKRIDSDFCSDKCRKAYSRRDKDDTLVQKAVIHQLQRMGMVGQLWPVMKHDKSPRVLGLIVPKHLALAELNDRLASPLSGGAFAGILKEMQIFDGSSGELRQLKSRTKLGGQAE